MTITKEKNDFIIYKNENTEKEFNSHFKINYNFGTFDRPKIELNNKNILNIFLDHSFEPEKDDCVMFIDHHLIEQLAQENKTNSQFIKDNYIEYCCSNANLMYSIYENIVSILKTFHFKEVNIFMHSDLDGIASGIIMRQILEDIKNDTLNKNNILLARILGNYGDLFEEAKYDLTDYFVEPKDVLIFDKKLKSIVKNFGRFMKAIRPSLHYYCDKETELNLSYYTKEVHELENVLERINIHPKELSNFLNDIIIKSIQELEKVDTFSIIMYLNRITSNFIYKTINKEFQTIIDAIIKEYLEPEFPQIEMTVLFKNDPNKTEYKLLTIETPFDCGRSVIWKYRSSYKQLLYKEITMNKWNYKLTDWKDKNHTNLMKNIACYNKTLNKLTLDGETESSFIIAKSFTIKGGGHCDTIEEGKGSIGSVNVIEKEFNESIIIKEFF